MRNAAADRLGCADPIRSIAVVACRPEPTGGTRRRATPSAEASSATRGLESCSAQEAEVGSMIPMTTGALCRDQSYSSTDIVEAFG